MNIILVTQKIIYEFLYYTQIHVKILLYHNKSTKGTIEKMKLKKIIGILFILFSFSNISVSSYSCSITKDGVVYTMEDKTLRISGSGSVTKEALGEMDLSGNSQNPIETIYMGKDIISIGAYAFNNWKSLRYLDLPTKLKEIGDYAFSYTNLDFGFEGGNAELNIEWLFTPRGRKLTHLVIHCDKIGEGAFLGSNLKIVGIGQVSKIDKEAFCDCNNLFRIDFDSSCLEIGERAFNGCASLYYLNDFNKVSANFHDAVFTGCTSLEKISMPGFPRIWGAKMFSGCVKLKTIRMLNWNFERLSNRVLKGVSKDVEIEIINNNNQVIETKSIKNQRWKY